ncbi:MAG TPA: class I SAM-dependent methyltransferase [Steroidobacteraceae bacterium]|jgi:predicted O-methyltransferase YrrM|nr:class I SAM-dependent methyltransferase [Steroidobacteraceae bacterium]
MLAKNSDYSVDPKFQALLARYHARMADEDAIMKKDPAGFVNRLDDFLLPIGPEVGWLLHALIVGRGAKRILELGTSYGYSTAFLADAARRTGGTVYTMDVAADKQRYARTQIEEVGLGAQVEWMLGDAVEMLETFDGPIDFVLVDLWKNLYVPCLNSFYGKLADNAVIAADNMLYPETVRADADAYRDAVKAKGNLQSLLLPVGNGIELSCLWKR